MAFPLQKRKKKKSDIKWDVLFRRHLEEVGILEHTQHCKNRGTQKCFVI